MIHRLSWANIPDLNILWGGYDIHPSFYNEQPHPKAGPFQAWYDKEESEMLDTLIRNKQPILGVCRGAQWLCIKAGGRLLQHVIGHRNATELIEHPFNNEDLPVPSDHHQVMVPRYNYKILSRSIKDNIPEIVHFPTINALAVQFHPEWAPETDPIQSVMNKLINTYLEFPK